MIPHLLVPELREALVETPARRVGDAQPGAAGGGDRRLLPGAHLEVLADARARPAARRGARRPRRRWSTATGSSGSPRSLGAELVVADLAVGDGAPRHDPVKLADAYARFLAQA